MARIRTIKPALARHRPLFEAEVRTGLPIRLTWALLPTVCDREGRFPWRPWDLKLDILPYDNLDFELVLNALVEMGQIVRYEVAGQTFGYIPTFKKHQIVNARESVSSIPAPVKASESTCTQVQESEPCLTPVHNSRARTWGRDGKGREQEGEGKGTEVSEPDPDDVLKIARLHPSTKHLQGAAVLPADLKFSIVEAIARDGVDLVLAGTRNLADAVATWPSSEMRFLPNPVKFYRTQEYLKDPRFWDRSPTARGAFSTDERQAFIKRVVQKSKEAMG